jgi:hypothetical protein
MTNTTTSVGVAAMSMYMKYDIPESVIIMARAPLRRIKRRPRRSTRYHGGTVDKR